MQIIYGLILGILALFSYGFVDPNFPYRPPEVLQNLVLRQRPLATVIYVWIIVVLFFFYWRFLRGIQRKEWNSRRIWQTIFSTAGILLLSFPAFSNDIFNYIATAKVTYTFGENPYVVMPLEIENEPMLAFLHAANKTALYGPVWILLTFIPHLLSFGRMLIAIVSFKTFVIFFYFGVSYLVWKLTDGNKLALAFFALNPLVIVETLISGHNDVVMMFFALLAFYAFKQKNYQLSIISYLISVFIKFATIFLLPVYLYVFYNKMKNKKLNWQKVWIYSAISMFIIFLISPLREEMYPWYFIWPLSFIALWIGKVSKTSDVYKNKHLMFSVVAFSFGLLLRFAPFVYYREWGGITPTIKKVVTFLPPLLTLLFLKIKAYAWQNKK